MDKDFKLSFVNNIIQVRNFALDDDITEILLDLVDEDITDQVFIAKVYTELNVYDTVAANMSNDLIDFNMPYGMTEKRRTTRTPLMTFNVALSTTTQDLYGLNDWKIGQTEDDQKEM